MQQHAGLAEDVLDHRLNTRTVYLNRINRYLYWNMGYHVEHHMFPMVPYHNLDKLHELMKADCPPPYNGLVAAYREVIPALIRQSKDPNYYVQRTLPAPSAQAEAPRTTQVVTSQAAPDAEGWVEVCELDALVPGDVLRFEHGEERLRDLPHLHRPVVRDRRPLHARERAARGRLPAGHLHRVPQAQRPLRRARRLGAAPAPADPAEDLPGAGKRRQGAAERLSDGRRQAEDRLRQTDSTQRGTQGGKTHDDRSN